MMPYPVAVEFDSPVRFERIQLALRFAIALLFGFVGLHGGWVGGLLYLALPVIAAATLATRGQKRFAQTVRPQVVRMLEWIASFYAYMLLVTDNLPSEASNQGIHFSVGATSQPTIGSALVRLLTSIPSALGFVCLAFVGCFLWCISALCILATESQPNSLLGYQRGVVRWQARLFCYHASLVDDYPPFSFETHNSQSGAPHAVST